MLHPTCNNRFPCRFRSVADQDFEYGVLIVRLGRTLCPGRLYCGEHIRVRPYTFIRHDIIKEKLSPLYMRKNEISSVV